MCMIHFFFPNNTLLTYKRGSLDFIFLCTKTESNMSFLLKKLVLLIILHVTLSEGALLPYGKAHVRLTNLLGSGSSLTIHCQSKDDDLGVHVLVFKDSFEWSFKPKFFIPSTLFFCKLQWQSKVMSFDSYRETRDLQGCNKYCYWDVTPDGPCMLKHGGNRGYDFCYSWDNKKIVGIEQGHGQDMP